MQLPCSGHSGLFLQLQVRDCCEDVAVAILGEHVLIMRGNDGFHVWHARIAEFKSMPVEDF